MTGVQATDCVISRERRSSSLVRRRLSVCLSVHTTVRRWRHSSCCHCKSSAVDQTLSSHGDGCPLTNDVIMTSWRWHRWRWLPFGQPRLLVRSSKCHAHYTVLEVISIYSAVNCYCVQPHTSMLMNASFNSGMSGQQFNLGRPRKFCKKYSKPTLQCVII